MGIEEQFILLSLGLATIIVRVGVRWQQVGPGNWQLDDYLMPLTGLVFTAETVAAYLVGAMFQGLTNSYMTDEERAALDPASTEHYNRQWGSKIQVLGWSFYAFILWALKFCVTAFYGRLTAGLSHLRLRVQIAYGLLGVTYLVVALTILLSCQPMHRFWQVNPDPGQMCRPTNSPAYVLVVVIPNILTDIYLLSIPLPMLWGVNISLRRRLTLIFLFSGAIFIMMAGTIRAVTILTSGPEGAVSGSQWACRETFVAIIVTNLPVIQPLLRRVATKIGLSAIFTRSSVTGGESHQLKSNDNKSNAFNNSRKRGSRIDGGGSRHMLSNQVTTAAWGSDEQILMDGQSVGVKAEKNPDSNKSAGIVVAKEISISSEYVQPEAEGRRSEHQARVRTEW